jgi:hypothetical protein
LEITTLAATRLLLKEKQENESWHTKHGVEEAEPVINYPTIVIEGFMSRDKVKNDFVYDLLSEWAAGLVDNHVAHVIFVSNNPSSVKSLSKSASNRSIETILLEDASTENALTYVRRRLGSSLNDLDLKVCVEGLGGRRTDLELLIQKVKAGLTPQGKHQLFFNSSFYIYFHSISSCLF